MTPKVTVAIAFRNPGRHFRLALQSVFKQTLSEWELLLLDDGSADDSLQIARSLTDPRVRVYSDGRTRGLASRLNEAAELARAPYFARMDADDVMHPDRLEKQLAVLQARDGVTVVGTLAYSIDADNGVLGLRMSREVQAAGFDARRSFIHPTVMCSVAWLRTHRYSVDPVYYRCEDAELWCRTASETCFVTLPEPLLFYREGGCFSLRNYIATSLGLMCLLRERYQYPRHRYLSRMTVELTKLGAAIVLEAFGRADQMVARRFKSLRPDERLAAARILEELKAAPLPADSTASAEHHYSQA